MNSLEEYNQFRAAVTANQERAATARRTALLRHAGDWVPAALVGISGAAPAFAGLSAELAAINTAENTTLNALHLARHQASLG